MLSNAISERVFSLQNHIKGPRSTKMHTLTLSHRIRVASDAPPMASDASDILAAVVTDDFWSSFTPTPARAIGAVASLLVRRKRSAAVAADRQSAKEARLDGTANRDLAGDGSETLTSRVEFLHDQFRSKAGQPTEITERLVGGLMAKLMVREEGGIRSEEWVVGRLKSCKAIRVALPQGGAMTSALLFLWQALNRQGHATGDLLTDLSLDISSCGSTKEWVMVEPKPVARGSTRGRSRGRGRGRGNARGRARGGKQ
jgi:hypothetical protein